MGLLSDRQAWGGIMAPLFFLGNYILYGVLMFVFVIVIYWSYKYQIYTNKVEYAGLSSIHPDYNGSPRYTVV